MEQLKRSDKIVAQMGKIAGNRYITAIRNGMSVVIPVTIIGSFFIIVLNLPIAGWESVIAPYATSLRLPMHVTIDLMSIYVCIGITISLCDEYGIDRASTSVLAVLSFLMAAVTPATISTEQSAAVGLTITGTVLPLTNLGANGLFTAMVLSIATVELVRFCIAKKWVIKMPAGVPPAVIHSFVALIPGTLLIISTWVLKVVLHFDLNSTLQWLFSPIRYFAGDSFLAVIMPILLITIVWLFGIHGMILAKPLLTPFWFAHLNDNMNAAAANEPIPHFLTEQFFQWFVWIGGAGATLALALLMAVVGMSAFCKKIGRFTLVPSLFNINEPLIFGVPLVMNPFLAIPFILAPLVMGTTTYLAMVVFNIVDYPIAIVPWTLPAPLGAMLATGMDWRAAVLALGNLALAVLIYYPFFKRFDQKLLSKEIKTRD